MRELAVKFTAATDDLKKGFGDVGKEAKSLRERFDGLGEGFGKVASLGAQAAGALSGLGGLIGGPFGAGMEKAGIAIQAAADAGDLFEAGIEGAKSAAQIGAKAIDVLRTSTLLQTAGMLASKTAMIATNVATKAWAAGQWLLNAALSANPIGIVIIAIAALVAGIVIAWKHSETFRKIVLAVWGAIKTAVSAVVGWFTGKVVPFFSKTLPRAIGVVVDWVKAHWPLLLSILTGPIGAAVIFIVRHWDQIKAATKAAWNAVKGAISGAWTSIVSGIRSKITSAVNAVLGIKAKIVGGLKTLAGTLRNSGATLIQNLIDGVLSKITAVADAARRIADKVKSFFPGSPVKEGPLRGWNGGHVGEHLVDMGLVKGMAASSSRVAAGARSLAGKVAGAFGVGMSAPRPPVGGGGILPPGPSLITGRIAGGSALSGDQVDQILAAVQASRNLEVAIYLDKGQVRDLARGEAEVVVREKVGAR